jgi:hypothetical protein
MKTLNHSAYNNKPTPARPIGRSPGLVCLSLIAVIVRVSLIIVIAIIIQYAGGG